MSDGSFQYGAGAAAWTIEGSSAAHRIKGAGQTPGGDSDQSAYRSELFGLWGILFSLKRFTEEYAITEGQILIACDGLSALNKAQAQHITDPNEKHHDIISAIWALRKLLPIQVKFKHVKGHQDGNQITALLQLAWMNIEMDADAKHKVSVDGPHEQMDPIPFEGWTCAIKGRCIIKHLMEELRKHLNGEVLLHHWVAKQRIDALTAPIIDWEMAGMATWALPRAQQKWVSKLSAKFLSYGTNMTRWKLGMQAKCPHCTCSQEDKEHIIWCPAESAVQVWNKSLEQLDNWMMATKMHPQLHQDIITRLRQWHENQPPDISSPR